MDESDPRAVEAFNHFRQTLEDAGLTLISGEGLREAQKVAAIKALEAMRDLCQRHAQSWDHAYNERSNAAAPSEYFVWHGRALEDSLIARKIDEFIEHLHHYYRG